MAVHRSSGIRTEWTVDTVNVSKLARALKICSVDVAKSFRAEMRAASDSVVATAKENASWSKKIPGSIKRTGSVGNLKIKAGGDKAPDAAPYENGGKEGVFRHPVFGGEKWVSQKARPFLTPALEAESKKLEVAIDAAIEKALSSL